MNKWLEIIVGVILLCIAIAVCISNIYSLGAAAWVFLKGGIIWAVIVLGLLFLLLGLSDLKD